MMDFIKINVEVGKLLTFLADSGLPPDEKVAVLDTAAGTIRSVIGAEVLKLMWANVLYPKGDGK